MRYAVTIVSAPGWVYSQASDEVADLLFHGLERLGHDVILTDNLSINGRQHIVLGAHLIPYTKDKLRPPPGSIIYNLEQAYPGSRVLTNEILDIYKTCEVWDYSHKNAQGLKRLGIPQVKVVPLGWMPELKNVPPRQEEDIDVLFYGELSPRRQAVLDLLKHKGVNVKEACGVFGGVRGELMARARLVVNIHSGYGSIFEAARVSYAVGNGCAVVSEESDEEEARFYDGVVAFAAYENIASECCRLLANDVERKRMQEEGPLRMNERPELKVLEKALAAGPRHLILGAIGGYCFSDIAPFVKSLRALYAGEVIFFDYGLSAETTTELRRHDIRLISAGRHPRDMIVVDRFTQYRDFLREHRQDYDRVLLTDVRDVIFQKDPFSFDSGPGLACFLEDGRKTIGNESFNSTWVDKLFGPAVLAELANKRISCSGTTMGTAEAVLRYTERMVLELEAGKDVPNFFGVDQSTHNYLLHTEGFDDAKQFNNGFGVYTLALVPGEEIEFDEQGLVKVHDQVPALLHQYDRHAVLQALYYGRYEGTSPPARTLRDDLNTAQRKFTGERFVSDLDSAPIAYEHWHRYLYASQYTVDKIVLDVASGDGYGTAYLAKNARHVVGVDISSETVQEARERYPRENLEFRCSSVEALPLDDAFCDTIVSFETIEHVTAEAQKVFLKEVKRVLKPNGIFIVSTPDKLTYSDGRDFLNQFHLHELYREEFKALLDAAFTNVVLLGQKIYGGSYLWPTGYTVHDHFKEYRLEHTKHGFRPTSKPKSALYYVALCSDGPVNAPTSFLADLDDTLYHL